MPLPLVIPKWGYFNPSKKAVSGLKRYLKYVAHRENPEHFVLDAHERWTDCGLGGDWKSIYKSLTDLQGPYVLAHNMLISPAPDLMVLVPDDLKYEVVREVTERTIETWHAERGLPTPEWAYVLHDRDTSEYGLQQLHAHIFIAGTIENTLGERESHRVNKMQVVADARSMKREDNLHRIAHVQIEEVLDRTIGLAWRELRPADPEPIQEVTQPLWNDLMARITTDASHLTESPTAHPSAPGVELEL